MLGLRKRLIRIYEEASGLQYEKKLDFDSAVEESPEDDENSGDKLQGARKQAQRLINHAKKLLKERDELLASNTSNPKIAHVSQDIRDTLKSLRESTIPFDEMQKGFEADMDNEDLEASARDEAQKKFDECASMSTLIKDYVASLSEWEHQRSAPSSGPVLSSMRFGPVLAKQNKSLDDLLPVYDLEEGKRHIKKLEEAFDEKLKTLKTHTDKARAQAHMIQEKIDETAEKVDQVDVKMDDAVATVNKLVKSTQDVRNKFAKGNKCLLIAIIIIVILILAYWIYALVRKFAK